MPSSRTSLILICFFGCVLGWLISRDINRVKQNRELQIPVSKVVQTIIGDNVDLPQSAHTATVGRVEIVVYVVQVPEDQISSALELQKDP